MTHYPWFRLGCIITALVAGLTARADVAPHALFRDHAVLQRERELPVWGEASPGEEVTVTLAKHTASTKAGPDGRWLVRLPAQPAGGPHTLTISGKNRIELTDVWLGEVWLCSGQSNMERQLGLRSGQKPLVNWEQEVAAANYPQIRHFAVARTPKNEPTTKTAGKWEVCSPATVAQFTAVGYYFARDLHRALKVPVGLIHSSYGGTPAESWTSMDVLKKDFPETLPAEQKALEKAEKAMAEYKTKEPALLQAWEEAVAKAKTDGQPLPAKPAPPREARVPTQNRNAQLFNGMIAPLIPYALRGVLWYQGEANSGRAAAYTKLFPGMINDWRTRWGQGDFPFLFVQIAPYKTMSPEIREAQLLTWRNTPQTAMVVTTDVGDAEDIHPTRKEQVGVRLALAARAVAYGENLAYSGPVGVGLQVESDRAVVSFEHLGGGLVAQDGGPLRGFTVSGDGQNFVPAQAAIEGNTVVVKAESVTKPVAVRYGWAKVPDVNLTNQAGLPATPFRLTATP